jgi:hypothetical protein
MIMFMFDNILLRMKNILLRWDNLLLRGNNQRGSVANQLRGLRKCATLTAG